jgi:hypothetical protein
MELRPGEALLLSKVRRAGDDGVMWSKAYSTVANRLIRMGLIECRFGPTGETEDGTRTGMRFVARDGQKIQRRD